MNSNTLLPLIITNELAETKAFYAEKAGFEIVTDRDGYLQVRYGGENGPELSFMKAGPTPGMGDAKPFDGRGLILSIPTADADTAHETIEGRGVVPLSKPANKPWGWRSFTVADPNGVVLDFFHVLDQSAVVDATG